MEVRGCAEILLLLVTVSNVLVSAEATTVFTLTPVHFCTNKVVSEHFQVSLELFFIGLRCTGLSHFEFFHVNFGGLNESGSSFLSQIKEVNVGLHVALTKQLD